MFRLGKVDSALHMLFSMDDRGRLPMLKDPTPKNAVYWYPVCELGV